jgi:hypothetical protein
MELNLAMRSRVFLSMCFSKVFVWKCELKTQQVNILKEVQHHNIYHLCFNIVDDITIHEHVIVCKVCYLDLTIVALCQWSMLWYDSFVVQCSLIKLWFVLMNLICLSQEQQLERHILEVKCILATNVYGDF